MQRFKILYDSDVLKFYVKHHNILDVARRFVVDEYPEG